MYSTYSSVLELVPLLDNIDKTTIKSFIYKAGQLINSIINDLYKIPIRKKENCNGKISITKDTNVIVGYGSDFTNLNEFSFLFLPNKAKTVRILSIESDNVAVIDENVTINYINQDYFILPDWITTGTEFLTVNLLLNREFSRKGYNQEGIQKYKDDYRKLANEFIYKIKEGIFYDYDLVPVEYNYNLGRLVYAEKGTSKNINDTIENEIKVAYD